MKRTNKTRASSPEAPSTASAPRRRKAAPPPAAPSGEAATSATAAPPPTGLALPSRVLQLQHLGAWLVTQADRADPVGDVARALCDAAPEQATQLASREAIEQAIEPAGGLTDARVLALRTAGDEWRRLRHEVDVLGAEIFAGGEQLYAALWGREPATPRRVWQVLARVMAVREHDLRAELARRG